MPISWIDDGYRHDKSFYQQNPAGTAPLLIPVPGHDGGDPTQLDIPGVPAYEGLSGELEVFVPFPYQPPPWLLQQSPSITGNPEANATAEMDGEGGGTLTHHRVWARGAAPEDADLLIPVEKLTWEHPDTAPESSTSTVIYLRIPAGENISEDFIDITPTFPQFTIPNQATYWEAIHHGSKERAQFFYVQTSTGTKPETIEVAVMVRKLTSDGKFKMPAQSQKAQSLSVAKLVPAQDESNPEQAYIPLQALGGGVGAGEQINPTKDPDHFRVVVRDPTKRGQSPRIRITTECDEPGFESYSDQAANCDQNTLQMSDQPGDGNQELIQSPTLILVSDDTDDAHPIDGVADNAPNDRSRKVALGSKVKVELIDWAKNGVFPVITVPVPKLKTLTINAVVMTDSPIMAQGQEAATQKVLMDLRKTNERYAQVGLRINLSNNGQPEFKQPPASGSIAEPPIAGLDNPNIRIFPPGSFTQAIGAAARAGQPVTENPSIALIYCKQINESSAGDSLGFAVMPSRMPGYQPLWNMLFLAPGDKDYLIAHELGHILTKRGHWYENYPFPEWPQGVNWPYSLETRINLMVHLGNWKDVTNEGPVGSLPAKRLNRIQHSAIWLHDQVK